MLIEQCLVSMNIFTAVLHTFFYDLAINCVPQVLKIMKFHYCIN